MLRNNIKVKKKKKIYCLLVLGFVWGFYKRIRKWEQKRTKHRDKEGWRRSMTKKGKKQLMSSAPWRGEESEESFKEGKLKVTRQGDGTSTMHVPASKSKHHHHDLHDDLGIEIDPELRYSFQRNFQVSNHYLIPNNFFNLTN